MPNAKPILLLVATLVLAACGGSAPSAPAPTTPPATPAAPEPTAVPGSSSAAEDGVLVTYETRGGECPNGPCGFTAVIHRDGTVERTDGIAQAAEDTVLERLAREIEQTDWAATLAVPFTGECPVNFDGQEEIYRFSVKGETIEIASCTTVVDPEAPPFSTVREILFAIGG